MATLSVFVSHSHADREIALYLDRVLKTRGARTFIDHEYIGPCDELGPAITRGLKSCDVLLLLWSREAGRSPWVDKEWRAARSLQKRVIPYVIDEASLPPELQGLVHLDTSDRLRGHVGLLRSVFGKQYRAGRSDPFPGHWRVEVDAGAVGGGFELELLVDGQVVGKTLGIVADPGGLMAAAAALIPGVLDSVNRPLPVTGAWEYDDRQQNLTLGLTCSYLNQTNTETIVVQVTGRVGARLRGRDSAGRTYEVWRTVEDERSQAESEEDGEDEDEEEDREDEDGEDEDEKSRLLSLSRRIHAALPKDLAMDIGSIFVQTATNFFEEVRRHDLQLTRAFSVSEGNLNLARFGVRIGVLRWVGSARRLLEEKHDTIEKAGPFAWFSEGGLLTELIRTKGARVKTVHHDSE